MLVHWVAELVCAELLGTRLVYTGQCRLLGTGLVATGALDWAVQAVHWTNGCGCTGLGCAGCAVLLAIGLMVEGALD